MNRVVGIFLSSLLLWRCESPAEPDLPTADAVTVANLEHGEALLVDDDRTECPDARHASIQAAVDAARPGGTVMVCAGVYRESVRVTKPLRLLGAQHGQDARKRVAERTEAVVVDPTPFTLRADDVVVDGFSIQVALGEDGEGQGIRTSLEHAGYRIENNVFESDRVSGIILGADGRAPSVVRQNRFRGRFGFAADGETSARNVVLADNVFSDASIFIADSDHAGFHIARNRFQGRAGILLRAVSDIRVTRNQFDDITRTAVRLDTVAAVLVTGNTLDGGDAEGVVLAGSNGRVVVRHNRVTGFVAGMLLDGASGVELRANVILGNGHGVLLVASSANTLRENRILENRGIGLGSDEASTRNTLRGNLVQGSGDVDCRDGSAGSGTAGTANSWTGNTGGRSVPPGLCSSP